MYNAVHCVRYNDWNKFGKYYRQTPYTEIVLEDDISAGVEYNVVDRVVLNEEMFSSLSGQMIKDTLLCKSGLFGEDENVNSLLRKLRGGVNSNNKEEEESPAAIVEPVAFPENNSFLFSSTTVTINKHHQSSYGVSQSEIKSKTEDSSYDNELMKLLCFDVENSTIWGEDYSVIDTDLLHNRYICPDQDADMKKENEESGRVSESVVDGVSNGGIVNSSYREPLLDWRVIDYVALDYNPSEYDCERNSFVSALTIAERITRMHSPAENSMIRRLKISKQRLSKARDQFIAMYGFPYIAPIYQDEVRERMEKDGKLLILLNHQLSQVGNKPVNFLRRGMMLSQLVVVVKHSNGRWYPASRRAIKLVVKDLVKKSDQKREKTV